MGSDGLGWLDFSDYHLAETIGVIALALILFEGGLTAGFREIRPVLRPALSLALVGTLVTAAIGGLVAVVLFDFSLLEGLLLGSIIASTDGAAIFAVLRELLAEEAPGAHARGRGRLQRSRGRAAGARLHRLDQAAGLRRASTCSGCSRASSASAPWWDSVVGWLAVQAFQRARLDTPGLYPGRLAGRRRGRIRRRGEHRGLGLPGGLPGRA